MKILFVSLFFILVLPVFAEDTQPIKIGIIIDLSGQGAYFGKQEALGARLAQDKLGAAGKDVTIVTGDSQLRTTTAKCYPTT